MDRSKPVVYLTFDDGPIPGPTEEILDLLDQEGVKATFFCVGDNVRKHPDVFKRVIHSGHSIGNHTYSHISGWNKDTATYLAEVAKCNEIFYQHGVKTSLFRPPYGKITRSQAQLLKNQYKILMWDILSWDYDAGINPLPTASSMKRKTGNGSLVLFHDSVKSIANTRIMLPYYIKALRDRGFSFSPLPMNDD